MKRTFMGWVGKNGDWIDEMPDGTHVTVSNVKGRQCEWLPRAWPPVKVKVTVETVKTTTRRTGRSRPAGDGAVGKP